jgi:menaquinone-dependent protoporphyrinogen oxidase
MMDKVLIAFTTWAGSTHQVAEEIARDLINENIQITILPAKEVKSINEYSAVILGTPIHAGQTTGDFNKFLRKYHSELSSKKTAFFVVCFNLIEDTESNQIQTISWLNKSTGKFPEIKPVSTGLFAGAAMTDSPEFNKLNFFVKKIIESMNKSMVSEKGKSDFRELEKIHAWTEDLVKKIT